MKKLSVSTRLKAIGAIAACAIAMMALPQQAHAFLGFNCPFQKNDALTASLKVIGKTTSRNIIVVNADEVIIGTSFPCNATQKCAAKTQKCATTNAKGQKCAANSAKCNAAGKCPTLSCGSKLPCPTTKQTLADGRTRTITKKCGNKNMTATVTALRNAQGKIVGAVLISAAK
ncbi:MAG: hypothetical protein ABI443_03990 [Chthoniobacterales bacterium]